MSRKNSFGSMLKGYRERMPPIDWKRLALRSIPYLIIFYLGDKLGWLYRHCVGEGLFQRLYILLSNVRMAFNPWQPSFYMRDLLTGLLSALAVYLVVRYKAHNAKKYRSGSEYGSARWGTRQDIAPFIDPNYENNILLTATERLTMNSRPRQPKYARNKNVLIIGGSGSGKTRFYVKPNLMQMHENASYVVTDPNAATAKW